MASGVMDTFIAYPSDPGTYPAVIRRKAALI